MLQSYCHQIFHALVLLSFNAVFLVRRDYLNHGALMAVSECECTLRIVLELWDCTHATCKATGFCNLYSAGVASDLQ